MNQPVPPDVASTGTGETEYTTSRKEAGKANGTAECSGIDITPTKNGGFTARCSYKQNNDAKGGSSPYQEADTYAFSTFDELVAYLRDELGAPADAAAPGGDVDVEQANATAQA